MNITGTLVLPADVVIVPISRLPEGDRELLKADEGGFAIRRPRVRSSTKLVDRHGAGLLDEFRSGSTVARAVAAYGRAHGLDPREVLDAAYELVRECVKAGFLVPAGSDLVDRIQPLLGRHERVGEWRILHCVRVMSDSGLYLVRADSGRVAALKILRAGNGKGPNLLENEADLLRHLDGWPAPRLLGEGEHEGRRYLVLEWREGVHPTVPAREIRGSASGDTQNDLWDLCREVLQSYRALHAAGVVHGDVHARNILIARDGRATLLDFGYSHLFDRWRRAIGRGTARFWLEPELARARLERLRTPASTPASDQYAVASLLYYLIVGETAIPFAPDRAEAMRQLVEDEPQPFSARGAESWPDAEAVLRKALAKEPEDRYPSISELADAWSSLAPAPRGVVVRTAGALPAGRLVDEVFDRLLHTPPESASWVDTPPTSSVNYGTAGTAYALCRLACIRDDAQLLTAADAWLATAEARRRRKDSFHNPALGVTAARAGRISPYHSETGIHLVRALIGQAMGSPSATRHAVKRFLRRSSRPCEVLDLTLGKASTLLGCTLLLADLRNIDDASRDALLQCGQGVFDLLAGVVDGDRPFEEEARLNLGISHGWGGILYTLLLWSRVVGTAPPLGTQRRLDELAGHAEPKGRGLRWPRDVRRSKAVRHRYGSGWCNGPAGMVFLWTLARDTYGADRYLGEAEGAAWNAWEARPTALTNLCCGLGGRGYALLNFYRATGESEWLARARTIADRAAAKLIGRDPVPGDPRAMSLWKGEAGVALLAAETSVPDESFMPLFEVEAG